MDSTTESTPLVDVYEEAENFLKDRGYLPPDFNPTNQTDMLFVIALAKTVKRNDALEDAIIKHLSLNNGS